LSGENKSSGYLGTSLDVSFGHRFYSFIFVLAPFSSIMSLLFPIVHFRLCTYFIVLKTDTTTNYILIKVAYSYL